MPKMIVIADGRSGVYAPEVAADYIVKAYGDNLSPELQVVIDDLLTLGVESEGYWDAAVELQGSRLPDGGEVAVTEGGGDYIVIYDGEAEQNAPPDAWDWDW